MDTRPIGIFDSGVGGLSIWREIARQLPGESTVYVADQAHLPYGPKPADTLRGYAEGITRFLLAEGCKAVVVACNSASAAALRHLRAAFADTPFIGMEPAVKPAAEHTRSRVVLVLATPATLEGELFTATTDRYARDIKVVGEPCPGLVAQIEAGAADSAETERMLRAFLAPGLAAGADHVILACTHYPFVLERIRRIVGPSVQVVDPAPAVVRQLGRVLTDKHLEAPAAPGRATHGFLTTSADVSTFAAALATLVEAPAVAAGLTWTDVRALVAQPPR
jgi:glutamate racemase